jgi:hypothetical protein
MSIDPSTILTFSSAVLVGGFVPLVVFFYTRRGQLRQLDTTSDATQITSAAKLADMMQTQIDNLTIKLEKAESQQTTDRTTLTEQLTRAHDENSRLAAIVATQLVDLDIARRQIEELRSINRLRMNVEESAATKDAMSDGRTEMQLKGDAGDLPPK